MKNSYHFIKTDILIFCYKVVYTVWTKEEKLLYTINLSSSCHIEQYTESIVKRISEKA